MEAQGGEEERDKKNGLAFEEQPISVTEANQNETKSKQSQNNCTSLFVPSSTENEKKMIAGSDENEHNNDGFEEIVEEYSNAEKEQRGVDAKGKVFNEGVDRIVCIGIR